MAREPVLAAGGIVLRREETPLIAVVRLRKRNEWVLPKGKLDDGETARAAAAREVLEETGHDVSVQEFLGTLVYESGGRSKVVHYWRMEASGEQAHSEADGRCEGRRLAAARRCGRAAPRADMSARFSPMWGRSRFNRPRSRRRHGGRGADRPAPRSAGPGGPSHRDRRSVYQRTRRNPSRLHG